MRQQLKNNGFTQIPQLTTNKDVNDRTFMFRINNEGIELFVQLPPPPEEGEEGEEDQVEDNY